MQEQVKINMLIKDLIEPTRVKERGYITLLKQLVSGKKAGFDEDTKTVLRLIIGKIIL